MESDGYGRSRVFLMITAENSEITNAATDPVFLCDVIAEIEIITGQCTRYKL
jgi:hypothetical protein